MRMKNLFPIICTVLILVGGAGSLIYFSSSSTEEPVLSTTYSVDEMKFASEHMVSELLDLKWDKQQCKDSLTEFQTIAEYKGIEFYCSDNDARIEQLKTQLAAILTMPYEQLDFNLNETKQEKDIEHLSGVVASGSWSLQALMDFLQSE